MKINGLENFLEGNIPLNEIGSLSLQHVYDNYAYDNPIVAATEFIQLNKEASVRKTTDRQTVNNFLANVYHGGDHSVNKKNFITALNKKGVQVKDRREMRLSDMERV
jgi:hypothetical protein